MNSISKHIFVAGFVLTILVSCSSKPKDPTEPFWGQWEYYDNENGYDAFKYDIEFLSDGTFLIPDTPFLWVNTFEYSLLDDHRLKLTALGISEIVGYELEGDQLKLIFEDGYNLYLRKDANLPEEGKEQTLIEKIREIVRNDKNQVSSLDGMELILVPAGEFPMGCARSHHGGRLCVSQELPLHTVYLDAYYIDKYEVTNAQYSLCVESEACEVPQFANSVNGSSWEYWVHPEFDSHPVVFVTWYDAQDYCKWAGRRLPTEAEWEKAARGETIKAFPWGDEIPDCSFTNFDATVFSDDESVCVGGTSRVGSYPIDTSTYGVMDMGGNVSEWVNDWYSHYKETENLNPIGPVNGQEKSYRGGNWYTFYVQVAGRHSLTPDRYSGYLGFRCASSIP